MNQLLAPLTPAERFSLGGIAVMFGFVAVRYIKRNAELELMNLGLMEWRKS